MSLRGINRVVEWRGMKIGGFYLAASAGSEPTLFQFVQTAIPYEGSYKQMALVYLSAGEPKLYLQELSYFDMLVEMPPVHVRVDPPSISGTGFNTSLRMNSLIVVDNSPIVVAPYGISQSSTISILTGRPFDQPISRSWVSFSRWSLVVDEAGEEITIAAFDD